MRPGFVPVRFDDYVERHLQANPDEDRAEFVKRLADAVDAYKRGIRCECGEPIWIVGTAAVGRGCFSCITCEGTPDNDPEIIVDDRIAQ